MDKAHLVQQLHAAIPYIPVAVSLAERVRKECMWALGRRPARRP